MISKAPGDDIQIMEEPMTLNRIMEYRKTLTGKVSEPSPVIMGRMSAIIFPPNVGANWHEAVVECMLVNRDVNRNNESKYYTPGDISKMQGGEMQKLIMSADMKMRQAPIHVYHISSHIPRRK